MLGNQKWFVEFLSYREREPETPKDDPGCSRNPS